MAISNKERQNRIREKRRKMGLVHFQQWITPAQAAALMAVLTGQAHIGEVSAVGTQRRTTRKKKLTKAQTAILLAEQANREVIRRHIAEVTEMENRHEKRGVMRAFLESKGANFGGKTVKLNSLLGPRGPVRLYD